MAEWLSAVAAVVAAIMATVALAVAISARNAAGIANDLAGGANDLAGDANELAKTGHTLAETANQTATDALGEATAANSIAEDANRIAERALYVAQDDVPYNWVLRVDDNGEATVINDCGHPARSVTVVLDVGGRVTASSEASEVVPFGKIKLDVEQALAEHFRNVEKEKVVYAHSEGGIMFGGRNGKPVSATFRATLRWQTEQAIPRTDVVSQTVRHQMTHDGLRRCRRDK